LFCVQGHFPRTIGTCMHVFDPSSFQTAITILCKALHCPGPAQIGGLFRCRTPNSRQPHAPNSRAASGPHAVIPFHEIRLSLPSATCPQQLRCHNLQISQYITCILELPSSSKGNMDSRALVTMTQIRGRAKDLPPLAVSF
jgi:hypothetical protein